MSYMRGIILVALVALASGCMAEELSSSDMGKSIAAAKIDAGNNGGDSGVDGSSRGHDTENEVDSSSDAAETADVIDAPDVLEVDVPEQDAEVAGTDAEVTDEVTNTDVTEDSEILGTDAAPDVEETNDAVDVAEEVSVVSGDSTDAGIDTENEVDSSSDAAETADMIDVPDVVEIDVPEQDAEVAGTDAEAGDEVTGTDVVQNPDIVDADAQEVAGPDADVDDTADATDALVADAPKDAFEVETVDAAETADAAETSSEVDAVDTVSPDVQPDIPPDVAPVDLCKNKNCDDGNACTADSCDKATGCINAPQAGTCEDGNSCTEGDQCKSAACEAGSVKNCDDGNACTSDSCNPTTGCANTKNWVRYDYPDGKSLPPEWTKSSGMEVTCENGYFSTPNFKYSCVLRIPNKTPAKQKEWALLDLGKVRKDQKMPTGNIKMKFAWALWYSSDAEMSWAVLDPSSIATQTAGLSGNPGTVKVVNLTIPETGAAFEFVLKTGTIPLDGPGLLGPITVSPEACTPPP